MTDQQYEAMQKKAQEAKVLRDRIDLFAAFSGNLAAGHYSSEINGMMRLCNASSMDDREAIARAMVEGIAQAIEKLEHQFKNTAP